jgi:hypothetical protein
MSGSPWRPRSSRCRSPNFDAPRVRRARLGPKARVSNRHLRTDGSNGLREQDLTGMFGGSGPRRHRLSARTATPAPYRRDRRSGSYPAPWRVLPARLCSHLARRRSCPLSLLFRLASSRVSVLIGTSSSMGASVANRHGRSNPPLPARIARPYTSGGPLGLAVSLARVLNQRAPSLRSHPSRSYFRWISFQPVTNKILSSVAVSKGDLMTRALVDYARTGGTVPTRAPAGAHPPATQSLGAKC